MKAAGKQTVEIDITADFYLSCEYCRVTPEQVLQYFVDNLFTFAVITADWFGDEFPIVQLIQNYTRHPMAAPRNNEFTPISKKYLDKAVKLVEQKMGKKGFLKLWGKLLTEWYDEVQSKTSKK